MKMSEWLKVKSRVRGCASRNSTEPYICKRTCYYGGLLSNPDRDFKIHTNRVTIRKWANWAKCVEESNWTEWQSIILVANRLKSDRNAADNQMTGYLPEIDEFSAQSVTNNGWVRESYQFQRLKVSASSHFCPCFSGVLLLLSAIPNVLYNFGHDNSEWFNAVRNCNQIKFELDQSKWFINYFISAGNFLLIEYEEGGRRKWERSLGVVCVCAPINSINCSWSERHFYFRVH